jgi:plasmid stabilization system protein ParE
MTFHVRVSERAIAEIESYRDFIATKRKAPLSAQRWVDNVFNEIASLAILPRRCPLAPENRRARYEVRMHVIGDYLVLFNVDDALQTVHILGFRHGHRRPAKNLPADPSA